MCKNSVPQKIWIVCDWYPHPSNEICGIFIKEASEVLSKTLDISVINITIIPTFQVSKIFRERNIYDHKFKIEKKVKTYRDIILKTTKAQGLKLYNKYLNTLKKVFIEQIKLEGKPNVIHAHGSLPSGWASVKIGQEFNIPVVITEHTGPFELLLNTAERKELVTYTLEHANLVTVPSPAQAEWMIKRIPSIKKLVVLPNCIRTDLFIPSLGNVKNEKFRFLAVASLSQIKGIEVLIEAVEILSKKTAVIFQLSIAGDGPDKKKIQKEIANKKLQANIILLGALNREQVKVAMSEADVFVLSSYLETFGMVVGEALACGTPVVITKCGGPEYVSKDCKPYLAEVGDAKSLAEALLNSIENSHKIDKRLLRENIIKNFGPVAFIKASTDLYTSMGR